MLIFPSRGPESLSRVLIEASALGVPIAAMDTGGTRDIDRAGRDGPAVDDLPKDSRKTCGGSGRTIALRERLAARLGGKWNASSTRRRRLTVEAVDTALERHFSTRSRAQAA